jgi:hypothetical protein
MPSPTIAVDPTVLANLSAIADLLLKYDKRNAVRFESRLRTGYPSCGALVEAFDTNEFWGGAGSLADQGMCVDVPADGASFRDARRAFWQHMARVGRSLLSYGAGNPRLSVWVDVFEGWCKDGL